MLSTNVKTPKPMEAVEAPSAPTDSNPPIFTCSKRPQHPIYGATPMGQDGFTLDRQNMHMLAHWHKKAVAYIEGLASDSDDVWLAEVRSIRDELFEAMLQYKPVSGGDAARQFEAICREVERGETLDILSVKELRSLVDGLVEATRFPEATKRIGDLQRGGKLTRAGLLHRYHAFLVGELQTLSWNLYGNRDYAMCTVPIDDAVTKRTSNMFKDGKPLDYGRSRRRPSFPFFDETQLTTRAKAVLGSLEISTTKPGRR